MLKIILMRHSEADYTFVRARNYIGHGLDLAQLTEEGIELAEKASFDSRLDDAEIIVSSPYTRALQTAAILSKNRQLNIKIELGLHEWMPDLTFQFADKAAADEAAERFMKNKGACPKDSDIKYENIDDLFDRAKNALLSYMKYKKIIVVTHGMLMDRFVSTSKIPHCGIYEIDFDESFACKKFDYL